MTNTLTDEHILEIAGKNFGDLDYYYAPSRYAIIDFAHAIISALPPEKAQPDEWQPIETAPKDGSIILACWNEHYASNGFMPQSVYWGTYHPNAPGTECWRNSARHKAGPFSHWIPLPKGPEIER